MCCLKLNYKATTMEVNIACVSILFVCIVGCLSDTRLNSFCWFKNWSSQLSSTDARFHIRDINASLCTHLIYANARIDSVHGKLVPTFPRDDNGHTGNHGDGQGEGQSDYMTFTGLKGKHPNLKTLLSVGEPTSDFEFREIVKYRGLMVEFAKNCAIFLRERNFDGMIIDWEWPRAETRDSLMYLLAIIRDEFNRDASWNNQTLHTLGVFVRGDSDGISQGFNIPEISKHVDYIFVSSYDFFGPWSRVTGFSDPLYPRSSDPEFNPELNQESSINTLISDGAPANKIVLGVSGFGLTFTLANLSDTGVGAPVSGAGTPGPYLHSRGHATYYRVCEMIKQIQNGSTTMWDDEQKMSYSVVGDQWVGYNTKRSIVEKMKFAYKKHLGGTAFWSLDGDDFKGTYCDDGKYPLLTALHSAIQQFAPMNPDSSVIG